MAVLMWHPTPHQWHFIWASTLIAITALLAADPQPLTMLLPFTVVGVLFIWNVTER